MRLLDRPVVYVDSGSVDGSVALARQLGVSVVELDPARPFSAARARNEGFAALVAAHAAVSLVQFLDADCTLLPGWLDAAEASSRADPLRAVVIGPLQERHPDASVYNRMCALEWKSPPGDLANFGSLGGIMLVRADVFSSVGGFDEQVIAGEDSEFGVRVAAAGFKVTKIAGPWRPTTPTFSASAQWWRARSVPGMRSASDSACTAAAPCSDCARERRSVLVWGVALPATILAARAGDARPVAAAWRGLCGARPADREVPSAARATAPRMPGSMRVSSSSASSPRLSGC